MPATRMLLNDNIELLEQAVALVMSLNAAEYSEDADRASSVGKHLRHIANHYEALLGRVDGRIDYETRQRGSEIETDKLAGLAKLDTLIMQLREGGEGAQNERIEIERIVCDTDGALETLYLPSSLERELAFLQQHTTHHFAVIALLLKQRGIMVAPQFGMSPSTIRFNSAITAPH